MNTKHLFFSVLFLWPAGTVANSPLPSAFYEDRTEALMTEYLSCTGDSTPQSTEALIEWKNRLNNFINTPQFPALYKKFVVATGMRDNVTPCDIQMWVDHTAVLSKQETIRSAESSRIRAVTVSDSEYIAADLQKNKASHVDFERIPFGVTKTTFKTLFSRAYTCSLELDGSNLIARKILWGGEPVSAVFHFPNDRLRHYELESAMLPSDSLDNTVRPVAQRLIAVITKQAGEPDRLFRVGFFDIIQDRISPYATWRKGKISIIIGLGTRKYRYFTRMTASVSD